MRTAAREVDPSRRNLVLLFELLDRSLRARNVKWIVNDSEEEKFIRATDPLGREGEEHGGEGGGK